MVNRVDLRERLTLSVCSWDISEHATWRLIRVGIAIPITREGPQLHGCPVSVSRPNDRFLPGNVNSPSGPCVHNSAHSTSTLFVPRKIVASALPSLSLRSIPFRGHRHFQRQPRPFLRHAQPHEVPRTALFATSTPLCVAMPSLFTTQGMSACAERCASCDTLAASSGTVGAFRDKAAPKRGARGG